jgi:hypothetical protein
LEEAVRNFHFVLAELLSDHVIIKRSSRLIPCLVLGPQADFGIHCFVIWDGEVAVVNPFFPLILVGITPEIKVIDKDPA